jgi:uncharacterized membrane protein
MTSKLALALADGLAGFFGDSAGAAVARLREMLLRLRPDNRFKLALLQALLFLCFLAPFLLAWLGAGESSTGGFAASILATTLFGLMFAVRAAFAAGVRCTWAPCRARCRAL